ncbi:MAG: N-acetyltransferase [Dysosmobacter sp.]
MIRPATSFDIPRALAIYRSARQFMRRSGNTVQWVNGCPSEALLRSDVAAGRLFVMEDAGGVYAVFAFIIGDDPTYQAIDGAWLDDETPYGTLHRLGSDGTHTGVLAEAVAWAWTRCPHLRADTHEDNHPHAPLPGTRRLRVHRHYPRRRRHPAAPTSAYDPVSLPLRRPGLTGRWPVRPADRESKIIPRKSQQVLPML